MERKFELGDDVLYQGKETHIEKLCPKGRCVIANPDWDWDEEGLYTYNNTEYGIPYWITVKLSELTHLK